MVLNTIHRAALLSGEHYYSHFARGNRDAKGLESYPELLLNVGHYTPDFLDCNALKHDIILPPFGYIGNRTFSPTPPPPCPIISGKHVGNSEKQHFLLCQRGLVPFRNGP